MVLEWMVENEWCWERNGVWLSVVHLAYGRCSGHQGMVLGGCSCTAYRKVHYNAYHGYSGMDEITEAAEGEGSGASLVDRTYRVIRTGELGSASVV